MTIKKLQNKRVYFLLFLLIFSFILIIYKLIDIQIINNNKYKKLLDNLTIKTVESKSTPRGRIYDRNYNLLVDNVGVKTIYFKRKKGVSNKDLIDTIKNIKDHIDIDLSKLTIDNIKEYYMVINEDKVNKLITKKEKKL